MNKRMIYGIVCIVLAAALALVASRFWLLKPMRKQML